ncbi:hypothetical protein SAMN05216338_10019 [Bradyrhizobium sp. Rc2d]|uniref:hypothetical protein n=1 Tax=Bradyrhizobium sp. Rc2d TaxID=1855321 RepID=UPI00088FE77C|nr:hypothetical protein [Bradyrhizobium sp. Rc2d]SDG35492.1 hypothetical protein SAMN05216338_10019 [Bradyrhizobium sp. Rc2d]
MKAQDNDRIADDLLEGANEIARFLFGPRGRRRRIYYLIANSGLPVFRLGETIYARRSTLRAWIAEQENAARPKGNVGKSTSMAAKV